MKILILQTARFGDILQTFPLLNAIKRMHPESEIHYVAKKRFAPILELTDKVDKVHIFDSQEILSPIIMSPFEDGFDDGVNDSLGIIQNTINALLNENFDQVYNLSFSPMSSYLTHVLTTENKNSKSFGYTRHEDGFLNFSDDVSSYFYAQVGVGGQNRVHITDLYAAMFGIDYTEEDWELSGVEAIDTSSFNLPNDYVVVHISASQSEKTITANQWTDILSTNKSIGPFVIIGTQEEKELADKISSSADVIDLVGKTNLKQLVGVVNKAKGFIGCDSLPMNICSFTDTKCYNLTFNSVRFWETGPLSKNAFIRHFNSAKDLKTDVIKKDLNAIFNNAEVSESLYYYNGNNLVERYKSISSNYDFSWELIKAIYMEEKFPIIDDMNLYVYAQKIGNLLDIIIENLEFAKDSEIMDSNLNVVSECEAILHKIGVACSPFRPLINWIYTEKIKIPPGNINIILDKTLSTYTQACQVMKIYLGEIKNEPVDLVK